MKFERVIKFFREGQCIRRKAWPLLKYLQLTIDESGNIHYLDGESLICTIFLDDLLEDDWEIYTNDWDLYKARIDFLKSKGYEVTNYSEYNNDLALCKEYKCKFDIKMYIKLNEKYYIKNVNNINSQQVLKYMEKAYLQVKNDCDEMKEKVSIKTLLKKEKEKLKRS